MSRRVTWLHVVLFLLTAFSTLVAGAMQRGVNPIRNPLGLTQGIPFSATLMLILLGHELAHYFTSRAHNTQATLPYFIPAPSIIGTFGAFIKMKSPILSRRALVDIGASGPIVGFAVSVLATVAGLAKSEFVVTQGEGQMLALGDSILFSFMAKIFVGVPPEGYDVLLHPVAFAGWIGLFITSLNLLPIGQLDGGHIMFALFGRAHTKISYVLIVVLAVLGMAYWAGWAIWAALMFVIGLKHPPVIHWEVPLDSSRKKVAWLSLVIFIITFIPSPFNLTI